MADPDHTSSETERAAEWSPAELDRLEDALERWTADDEPAPVPEDSSLSPRMRERLASYRELMTMSRAEMALEEVPEGLLAGVLAEAARSGAAPVRDVKDDFKVATGVGARVGFWERLRRSMLLPGVALAGSAALLLWMVQPDERNAASFDLQAANTAPARLATSPGPAPAAAQEPAPGGVAAEAARQEKAADEGFAPAAAPAPAPIEAEADAMKESKLDSKSAAGRPKPRKPEMPVDLPGEYLPGLEEVPADASADKDELRDTLESADKARRKGRCSEAIKIYLSAMGMSGPRDEQARARAGYALCLQSQGDDATASKYFDIASKLSPGSDAWVKRERGEGAPKKAPAKSKVSVDDPFK